MKEEFVDSETGWFASRERVSSANSGVEVIEETLTDPLTGEVYRSRRAPSYARPIAEWVGHIQESKELMTETERGKRWSAGSRPRG